MKSTILGIDGQPLNLSQSAAQSSEPQSAKVSYLQREFERHPSRGLTPARLNTIMVNAEQGDLLAQLELAEDMEERDAHLYAELHKRRGAISLLDWSIEAPDAPSAEETKLTEQMRLWFDQLQMTANGVQGGVKLLMQGMTDGILKGFAPIEMVWALVDGARIPQLTLQPQRWFTPSADRRHLLLRSRDATEAQDDLPSVPGEELQPLSWLMHMHPAKNGYVARNSLARVLFWPYLFKNYAVRDLAEFLEIYGLPLRVGKYPSGASDEEKRRLLQAVVQIGHNAAGIIPSGMELDFEAAAAGTEVPFVAMWDRLDAAESKAILGQTLSASEGQHGTQALGQVHNEVRHDIRDADAALLEGSISQQLIKPLALLNFAGAERLRMPRFVLDTGEAEDLEVYADNLPKLAGAGVKIGVNWVAKRLRIPEPKQGEELLRGPSAAGPSDPNADPGANPLADPVPVPRKAALAGQLPALQRDPLDDIVDEAAAGWRPLLQPMVQPLLAELDAAVKRGESLQAFAAKLPGMINLMDSQAMAEDLARANFQANLAGQADIELNPRTQE